MERAVSQSHSSDSQLKLTILPTDVKLITKPEDLYQWSILTAGKAALFNKQLSKHLTRAYIDLRNGAGYFSVSTMPLSSPHTFATLSGDDSIPKYRIDLSLPPEERYLLLAKDFSTHMQEVVPLFDEVLETLVSYSILRHLIHFLARIFLWRLYSDEETRELQSIAQAASVDLFYLVALNVALDGLLGCTSGGIVVKPSSGKEREERMMHFRTLDWGMDNLRKLIVVLEFVRSADDPEVVVARSVTYAGFLGVLTGVRENLSISLNFRGSHSCSTISLRFHQLLVLIGLRAPTTTHLRIALLCPTAVLPLLTLATNLSKTKTSPCYIILCDSNETIIIQKDLTSGTKRCSNQFVACTNHDQSCERGKDDFVESNMCPKANLAGMEIVLEESEERYSFIRDKWIEYTQKQERQKKTGKKKSRWSAVGERALKNWIQEFPITNECTNFVCLLDPKMGQIRWLERGWVADI
ncbi:hypothetical protein V501_02705 [Pseudogymnoascus sp. VKM F-4519 (FW-2642)]|nr:hypothetical protein V501_02705 [Pseudogymnoascus sp. VKM F-4519 (FW-2642)]